ncbi:MAG: 2-oxoacid:acceptor oxidoreductase family protein [Nitrospirae bacterium]|nr:2-oxoacid:acceptor oxidoreductase family protein [Nitrospirota bacterium]MBF0540980.1 2-oxoacid:acceptor oxidoreductase family protein [Nitrospirota bacterium]
MKQENTHEKKLLIAGSGGQGILFMGKVLAYAAMLSAMEVTWFPSYGAEMRGGTANCSIVISDEVIGSPVLKSTDILVVFNKASLERFKPFIKKDGILFYDSSLLDPIKSNGYKIYGIEASRAASELGEIKAANMVMLGAVINVSNIVTKEILQLALSENTPEKRFKTFPLNSQALYKGFDIIEDQKRLNS